MDIKELRRLYELNKNRYAVFLQENYKRGQSNDPKDIFGYFAYNMLLTQTDAGIALGAVNDLKRNDTLYTGDAISIQQKLMRSGYRFHNKGDWIYENRAKLMGNSTDYGAGIIDLVNKCKQMSPVSARNYISDNYKGLGMKTASHLMRGLSLSNNQLAIIDVYILRYIEEFGIVSHLPRDNKGRIRQPYRSEYIEYEHKMKVWCDTQVGIPFDLLDLLLWEIGSGNLQMT